MRVVENPTEIPDIENRVLVCDSEANGLLFDATTIWCIAAIDESTEEVFFWEPDSIKTSLEVLSKAKHLVFHNYYGYDYWLFRKLYPWWDHKSGSDTLVMSCLFDADRPMPDIPHGYGKAKFGTHSIEAWGIRFGQFKPSHEDWSRYSEEMKHRCIEDTWIGLKTYRALKKEQEGWDWSQSLALEHKIAKLHGKQILNGVKLDVEKAEKLLTELDTKISVIEERLRSELPRHPVQHGSVEIKKPFLKNGNLSSSVIEWCEFSGMSPDSVWGQFTRITWEEINLNSDQQIKNYLLSNGWQPTEWNYKKDGKYLAKDEDGNQIKTSPKLTEDSFHTVEGDVPRLITQRAVLIHRRGMIKNTTREGKETGWLNIIRSDGRVEAGGLTTATPTGRYKHFGIVNVPKASCNEETGELIYDPEVQDPIYGTQLRELFTVEDGMVMVGCDAVSLETTIQSHFVYNRTKGKKLAESILSGEFKKDVARVFTKPWKQAKNGYYALLYGAKIPKFSDTLGVPQSVGGRIYNNFWKENPALDELKNDLEKAYKSRLDPRTGRSYIKGLDGRKLWIRNPSAAMNALFQSSGSIVVKTAICFAADKFEQEDVDVKQLIVYHDEVEYECKPEVSEKVCEVLKWAFKKAGEYWKLNVPTSGDPKVGLNWAQVH